MCVCDRGGAVFGFYVGKTEESLLLLTGYKAMEGLCCRPVAGTGSIGCFHTHKAESLAYAENFRKFLLPLVVSLQSPLPKRLIIVLT